MNTTSTPNTITAILIDDEPAALADLRQQIKGLKLAVDILGEAMNIREGLQKIETLRPDLIFLDIGMPGGSGFELLRQLNPKNRPEVIFVTCEERHAMKAIRVSALFYILKPVEEHELQRAVSLARERIRLKSSDQRLEALLSNLEQSNPENKRVGIPSERGLEYVDTNTIVYCEGEKGYTYIYLEDGSNRLSSYSIGEYRKMLEPYGFFAIHRSSLVNRKHVVRNERSGRMVLSNQVELVVSRRRREDVLRWLSAGRK
ncbi:LytR/AlgR family response regulator transcription factor [Neolewinella agarilytica]|uniref:Two component transcriptional regulator, LytTR family n=1 Tax=Neolewinella agarilytica TaxID=478744 RepID=A0A1H9NJZ6_9BACT|nr:LytTR family DNA-binding domain-containing protein [Neolewinella agarilytica]SER36067.1 two component transcriptional regulator, LytTR family [Neolewinella agarilytica]